MPQDVFKTQIIALNRVTVPARTMRFLELEEGDWVEVIIQKIKK